MSPVQLGSEFKRSPDYGALEGMLSSLQGRIAEEVRREILAQVAAMVTDAVSKIKPPIVHVPAPQVSVAAPGVTVTPTFSPNITVDVPGEDDAGEIEAMDRQTVILSSINDRLIAMNALLMRPVVREVERDNNGRIIRVTETR